MLMPRRLILAVLITSGFVVLAGCRDRMSNDQRAVKIVLATYTKALQRNDYAAAYQYLSSESRRSVSPVDFMATWGRNARESKVVKFSIGTPSVVEQNGRLYAVAVLQRSDRYFADGKTFPAGLDYHLAKEGDTWRILRTEELESGILGKYDNGQREAALQLARTCLSIDPMRARSADDLIAQLLQERPGGPSASAVYAEPDTSALRFEVTSTSFDQELAATMASYIYVARIDFKVTNTGATSIECLVFKAVWRDLQTQEFVNEGETYVVNSGETPMRPGESRSGFLVCGIGDANGSRRAREADILVSGLSGKFELVRKGIKVE
jgi:hypothetical protein